MKRDMENAMLGGVCAGLAKKWNMDVKLVRVLFIIATLISHGIGVFAYIILWMFLDKE